MQPFDLSKRRTGDVMLTDDVRVTWSLTRTRGMVVASRDRLRHGITLADVHVHPAILMLSFLPEGEVVWSVHPDTHIKTYTETDIHVHI